MGSVLIDTNNNDNFTTSTQKKLYPQLLKWMLILIFKKKAIINNLISHAKLISSSKTILFKELKNIKKNVSQQNKHCNTLINRQTFIKHCYHNQMHYNYKLDENILKTLIQRNVLSIDPNKKIKNLSYTIINLKSPS